MLWFIHQVQYMMYYQECEMQLMYIVIYAEYVMRRLHELHV